jgi:hypothetical protein
MTLVNLAEQCFAILKKGTIQEYIQAVKNAYGTIVKKHWYEAKADGVDEVNGSFIVTFKDIKPELDVHTNKYYIIIPSSYLELPNQMGVNHISFMNGQDMPFALLPSGISGLLTNLKAFAMGGNQLAEIEGNRMYFPKMKSVDVNVRDEVRGLLLKLSVAFDGYDDDAQLNISPTISDEIVSIVVEKYQAKEKGLTNNLV